MYNFLFSLHSFVLLIALTLGIIPSFQQVSFLKPYF